MKKPRANKYGSYDEAMCTVFKWEDGRNHIRILVVEAKPGVFLTGMDLAYACGNYHSCSGLPSSNGQRFSSLEAAVEHERQYALRHFDPAKLTDSCATDGQRKIGAAFRAKLLDGWPLRTGIASAQMDLFGNLIAA